MKWVAVCNGGPNDTTVGRECKSLGQAVGNLEAMMKELHATIGQVYQEKTGQQSLEQDRFVSKEEGAGRERA